MTKQDDLFDGKEGKRRKAEGMALAADARMDKLARARQVALILSKTFKEVDADMVGQVLKKEYGIDGLGPAAGSIFRDGNWEFTGKRITSKRKANNARELKVWRRA